MYIAIITTSNVCVITVINLSDTCRYLGIKRCINIFFYNIFIIVIEATILLLYKNKDA